MKHFQRNFLQYLLLSVFCVALVSIPALTQTKTAASGGLSDQQFVNLAAQTDMIEANLGQMAADSASSQKVKDYAQMLVADHTADYKQLQTIGQLDALTIPTAIDPGEYNQMIAPFQKLKGAAFDQRYAKEMVAGHTKALQVYQQEGTEGQGPDIKTYAQATVPTLEKHLSDAQNLAAK